MRKSIVPVLHALVTLACAACCVYLVVRDRKHEKSIYSGRQSLDADHALRRFQDVRWLGGDYELPAGEEHCGIAVLMVADGKFTERRYSWKWSPSVGEPRAIPYLVMWGRTPSGPQVMAGGVSSIVHADDPFASLDAGLTRSHGTHDCGEFRGYRVIGFATSKAIRPGEEKYGSISSGDVDFAIRVHRHVAILVVKPFPTSEAAKDWAYGQPEPPDS